MFRVKIVSTKIVKVECRANVVGSNIHQKIAPITQYDVTGVIS